MDGSSPRNEQEPETEAAWNAALRGLQLELDGVRDGIHEVLGRQPARERADDADDGMLVHLVDELQSFGPFSFRNLLSRATTSLRCRSTTSPSKMLQKARRCPFLRLWISQWWPAASCTPTRTSALALASWIPTGRFILTTTDRPNAVFPPHRLGRTLFGKKTCRVIVLWFASSFCRRMRLFRHFACTLTSLKIFTLHS